MCKKIYEGDVFIISNFIIQKEEIALKKQIRLGKVVFISKITQKTVGIVVSENIFNEIPDNISNVKFIAPVLYTGDYLLKNGNWSVIGNQVVTDLEKNMTTRLIGNSLWRLDSNLGIIDNKDRKKYSKQLIYGFEILYSIIDDM